MRAHRIQLLQLLLRLVGGIVPFALGLANPPSPETGPRRRRHRPANDLVRIASLCCNRRRRRRRRSCCGGRYRSRRRNCRRNRRFLREHQRARPQQTNQRENTQSRNSHMLSLLFLAWLISRRRLHPDPSASASADLFAAGPDRPTAVESGRCDALQDGSPSRAPAFYRRSDWGPSPVSGLSRAGLPARVPVSVVPMRLRSCPQNLPPQQRK
jgi:hypothetical protein